MGVLANVSCVSIRGRGLLLEGGPGSGKSSLAMALIDRGAVLIGDDGVLLEQRVGELWAHPPPNIAGKLEIRGVGIVDLADTSAPIALVLSLDRSPVRLPAPEYSEWQGTLLPRLGFQSDGPYSALRAEWALKLHGLAIAASPR